MLASYLEVKRLDTRRVIYKLGWEPWRLDPGELLYALKLLRASRCPKARRQLEKQGMLPSELRREALEVLSKGCYGERGSVDPAMNAAPHMLAHEYGPTNIGMWWCDGESKGAYFTVELAEKPYLTYNHRRAIAVNPWDLASPSDLDTIMDSRGEHKSGTLGTSPFSFSRHQDGKTVIISGSFKAKSSATISSIILLTASRDAEYVSSSAGYDTPAPKGTCDPDVYTSIYMPVWGFDVSIDIIEGVTYGVNIKLYAP